MGERGGGPAGALEPGALEADPGTDGAPAPRGLLSRCAASHATTLRRGPELYGAITRLRRAGGEVGAGRALSGLMRSPSTDEVEDSYSAHFHSRRSGLAAGGAQSVEGLQMGSNFSHQPVLADEVAAVFTGIAGGTVVDATVGGGGHALAILSTNTTVRILGIDVDEEACSAASEKLQSFSGRFEIVRARFDELESVVAARGALPVSGVLFDLGVSSHQLDVPRRGFSYRQGGPLDMRMDISAPLTAADVVNSLSVPQLAAMFAANGEPVFAMRIARAIEAARPVTTTTMLAEIVRSAIPARARRTGGHPAARVFQAIRIAVNAELDVLDRALNTALEVVSPGGRIAVISYHSGEDRIVKRILSEAVRGTCACPPALPCACGAITRARFFAGRGATRPSEEEIVRNPRAASARLRAIEITPARPAGER